MLQKNLQNSLRHRKQIYDYQRGKIGGDKLGLTYTYYWASQVALVAKNRPANAADTGSIPGLGRSPGGGHGNHSGILAWRIP